MHARNRVLACLVIAAVGWTLAGVLPARATTVPKNGPIAFYMDRGNGSEIFSISHTGADLRQLTHEAGEWIATAAQWSPDGRLIVFDIDDQNGTCAIELMHADGSGVVNLTKTHGGCDKDPSFTPDGRRIVFVRATCLSCREAIVSMNLKGGDRRRIIYTPRVHGRLLNPEDPNVSPNGTTLAFVGGLFDEANVRALYTVKLDGTHLTRVVPFHFHVGTRIEWAPSGDRIVFTEYETGPGNTMTVRPDGSDLVAVTHYRGDVGAGGAVYSADGRWILFRLQSDTLHSLWKMRPDGSDKTRIRRLPARFGGLDWGPQPM
jgi:Tol biopolymer transport system component